MHDTCSQKCNPFSPLHSASQERPPHLNENPILQLRGTWEVDVLGEIRLEQEFGDQLFAEDLHEYLRHPCLLLD